MQKIIYVLSVAVIIAGCNLFARGYDIDRDDMLNHKQLKWEKDSAVLVMDQNQDLETIPLQLEKGKYTIKFRAKGTMAAGTAPHLVIRFGTYIIKDMHVEAGTNNYQFNFELPERVYGGLRLIFDNSHHDETGDRNIYLHFPVKIDPF